MSSGKLSAGEPACKSGFLRWLLSMLPLLPANSFRNGGTATMPNLLSSGFCEESFPQLPTPMRLWLRSKCAQMLLGKGTVQSGARQGESFAKQGRCHYCIKGKKKEDKEGSRRSRRTAYTCSCHPKIYCCKAGLGDCWLDHLADCGDEFITSDHSGIYIDGGGDASI